MTFERESRIHVSMTRRLDQVERTELETADEHRGRIAQVESVAFAEATPAPCVDQGREGLEHARGGSDFRGMGQEQPAQARRRDVVGQWTAVQVDGGSRFAAATGCGTSGAAGGAPREREEQKYSAC